MRRHWFLSYNSHELNLMESLDGALRRKAARAVSGSGRELLPVHFPNVT